jgi:hypothetical protein
MDAGVSEAERDESKTDAVHCGAARGKNVSGWE